jgi:hypothetical protein
MKAVVRLTKCNIEVQGDTQKALFEEMARACEVFGESSCGLCGSENIRPVTRTVPDPKKKKNFIYYEYVCEDCRARLALGQNNEGGTLFPKRKLNENGEPDLENGRPGKHRGWHRWKPNKVDEAEG